MNNFVLLLQINFFFAEGDKEAKIDELVENVAQYKNDLKFFSKVIYTKDGRTKLYTEKMFIQILKTIRNDIKENESSGSISEIKSKHSSEGKNSIYLSNSLKGSFAGGSELGIGITGSVKSMTKVGYQVNCVGSKSQNQINDKNNLLNKSNTNTNKFTK